MFYDERITAWGAAASRGEQPGGPQKVLEILILG